MQVRESYFIGPFTLDSVAQNPVGTLKSLQNYDLAVNSLFEKLAELGNKNINV